MPVVKSHDACKSNSYKVGFKLHLAYVNFTFVSFYCATNMKGTLGDFFYHISNFIYGSLLFAARFVENTFHKNIFDSSNDRLDQKILSQISKLQDKKRFFGFFIA